jgi:hypothetical protein
MIVEHSNRGAPKVSVYEERYAEPVS